MPNPYDRMFPGQAPDQPPPGFAPGEQIPGVPQQYQGLQPGQTVPYPVGVPPVNPMAPPAAPEPLPGVPPQYQAPLGQPIPPQGLPPQAPAQPVAAQPVAAPAPAQIPAQPRPAPVKHGPGMVETFDQQIDRLQKQVQADSAANAQAIQEGATNTAQAQRDLSTERLANAVQLADKQAEIQKHNQELDAIDAANLKQARDATIPDFWASREGARVGSTIAVALAGIGAGLLGSTNNVALNAVQHNIDQYFHREKERIDNLYKYAQEQGKLNSQTRLNYAQDLLNLKDQHSYTMQAAADRVNAVATEAKGAVDASAAKLLATKFGEVAIKDKQDVRELRSKIMLQEAQAEAARGSAAESNARAKQGGYLTPAQQQVAAVQLVRQLDAQYKYITDPQKGIAAHQRELGAKLKAIQEAPNNPENWVALVDSAIRTNTGRAAIMSQYNLYMGHAAGAEDSPEQLIAKFRTNLPSPAQQAAILGAAKQAHNETRAIAAEANKNYHAAVEGNPLYENNPAAKAAVQMHERNVFGSLEGYGQQAPVQTQPQNQDQAAINWAKSNPNDPRSAAILKANGL